MLLRKVDVREVADVLIGEVAEGGVGLVLERL